ncbi:uncharacterized protein LOC144148428 [Haemaphysalis longicornis]
MFRPGDITVRGFVFDLIFGTETALNLVSDVLMHMALRPWLGILFSLPKFCDNSESLANMDNRQPRRLPAAPGGMGHNIQQVYSVAGPAKGLGPCPERQHGSCHLSLGFDSQARVVSSGPGGTFHQH